MPPVGICAGGEPQGSSLPRPDQLDQCRQLLGMPIPEVPTESSETRDYRDRCEELNGVSLRICPVCRRGRMVLIDTFEASSRPAIKDTS